MGRERVLAALCIIVSLISVAIAAFGKDGAMIALSSIAVLFSALCFVYCAKTVYRYSAIMSVIVFACTVILVSANSYKALVDGGVTPDNWWLFCGVVQGIAVVPLIIMFFFTMAAMFNASYNWVTVPGLGWLIGMGMQVPKCILIFLVQYHDLVRGAISNNALILVMLVGLLIFIIFCIILRSVFKKNRYLITANGLVVRQ